MALAQNLVFLACGSSIECFLRGYRLVRLLPLSLTDHIQQMACEQRRGVGECGRLLRSPPACGSLKTRGTNTFGVRIQHDLAQAMTCDRQLVAVCGWEKRPFMTVECYTPVYSPSVVHGTLTTCPWTLTGSCWNTGIASWRFDHSTQASNAAVPTCCATATRLERRRSLWSCTGPYQVQPVRG